MDDPVILLTNDDGIDSPGFRALCEELSAVGSVQAVAPATDQSAVGRAMSTAATVDEHELGYELSGTPADCVVAGLESLVPEADLVVSGCNQGANLGAYVLGRSGTVSAAVEAAFFDVPAIAVSQYVDVGADVTFADHELSRADYAAAVDATRHLVEHAVDAGVFEQCDFVNVNAPAVEKPVAGMRVTEPSRVYDMTAEHGDGSVELVDRIWARMASGDLCEREGTDRRAVLEGYVSVSPLTAPYSTEHHEALDDVAESYTP
jgi:5'-nucleotidase